MAAKPTYIHSLLFFTILYYTILSFVIRCYRCVIACYNSVIRPQVSTTRQKCSPILPETLNNKAPIFKPKHCCLLFYGVYIFIIIAVVFLEFFDIFILSPFATNGYYIEFYPVAGRFFEVFIVVTWQIYVVIINIPNFSRE